MYTYVSLSIRNIIYNNDNENSNLSQKAKKKKLQERLKSNFQNYFFFFVNFALDIKCVAKMKEETIIK